MAAENINERGRWPWQRRRWATKAGVAESRAAQHGDAASAIENLPDLEPVSHARDAEMILAVFRTVVLGAALIGPFLFYSDYSLGWRDIAPAFVRSASACAALLLWRWIWPWSQPGCNWAKIISFFRFTTLLSLWAVCGFV
jgi:hypothetical protein